MKAKVIFIAASAAQVSELAARHFLEETMSVGLPDGRKMVVAYPHHYHTRFALAEEPGVVVLPGSHDPAAIGEPIASAFSHVAAKATESPREIGLRLHGKFGPAFHPDT